MVMLSYSFVDIEEAYKIFDDEKAFSQGAWLLLNFSTFDLRNKVRTLFAFCENFWSGSQPKYFRRVVYLKFETFFCRKKVALCRATESEGEGLLGDYQGYGLVAKGLLLRLVGTAFADKQGCWM